MTDDVLIIPGTGEVITLNGDLETFVGAWHQLREMEADLRTVKREISDEIARRLDHEGRRSLAVGEWKFSTTAPTEKVWNLAELQATLAELEAEGTISDAKAERCIKWEPKAVWTELKALLSDPRCKARVEHCFSEEPAARYAKVERV